MTLLEQIFDEEILEWREKCLEEIRDADTLPGVFGELQKTVLIAEVDLKAIDAQTQLNEKREESR